MREQFEKYWFQFYKGSVYDALVSAGVSNAQMKQILTFLRDQYLARLQAKKTQLNAEITKAQAETP